MMHTGTAKTAVRRVVCYVAEKGQKVARSAPGADLPSSQKRQRAPRDPWADRGGLVRGVVRVGVVLVVIRLAAGRILWGLALPLG